MIITKDMLKPGVYNERGKLVTVTKNDVENIEKSVQVLHEMGYRIPAWMEHSPIDQKPAFPIKNSDTALISQAEGDPWFAGWVKGIRRDSDDMLHPELDVPDHLGKRLVTEGTYLSPLFGEWDEIKEKAPMALLHVAFTRRPVNQNQQKKFQQKSESPLDTIFTSEQTAAQTLADAMKTGVKTFSFSLGDSVNFPNHQAGGQQAAGAAAQSYGNQPGQQGQMNQPPQMRPSDPTEALKQKLQQALQAMGIILDQSSPILQHPEELGTVLNAIIAAEGQAAQKSTAGQQPGQAGSSDQLTEQSNVIAMSQTANTAVTPPAQTPAVPQTPAVVPPATDLEARLAASEDKIKQFSQTIVVQQNVNKVLQARINEMEIKELDGRINALLASGRCTADQATKFRDAAKTHAFSLENPEAKTPLHMQLEVHEQLPEGAFWSDADRLNAQNVTQHSFSNHLSAAYQRPGDVSEEKADEIVKEMTKQGLVASYGLNRQ